MLQAQNLPKVTAFSKIFWHLRGEPNFAPGEMAERSIAAVLKTVEGHTSGGSNPSLSALIVESLQVFELEGFFITLIATQGRLYDLVLWRISLTFCRKKSKTCFFPLPLRKKR